MSLDSVPEKECISSSARPIVLVENSKTTDLAKSINRGLKKTGVFLPDSALYKQLLEMFARPLALTSFNVSGEPIYFDESQIELKDYPELTIVTHNRKIENPVDDSVLCFINKNKIPLRMAKGVAPYTFELPGRVKKNTLAVGGSQKVTIALAQENSVLISPPIGDILTLAYETYFEDFCDRLMKMYSFRPEIIMCDAHSGYYTHQWAMRKQAEWNVEVTTVYHHHAHALSLLVEHNIPIDQTLFCVVWDGVGLGHDGLIRGGEFIEASYSNFNTKYSFLPFYLAGNESAIKETWKMGLSILFQLYGESALKRFKKFLEPFGDRVGILYTAWKNKINMPQTTSAGRLFDAAASLLGICHINTFEGEAAMRMEDLYDGSVDDYIEMDVIDNINNNINNSIDWCPLFLSIIENKETQEISYLVSIFINSMAWLIVKQAQPYGQVGLTGGVFQNRKLLGKIIQFANQKKVRLYLHSHIPCNDGGLSAGQVAVGLT
ncbi:MAG: Sua5/YciO/YrdC/YwlC family protein [Leptospirales bacterium]